MQQAVLARQNVDEGAEFDDALHPALVNLADLRLRGDFLNAGHRRVHAGGVLSVDAHRSVIVNVHIGAGLIDDGADGGAALADDVADLLPGHVEHRHGRRILGDVLARRLQHLVHLVQDVHAGLQRLVQRLIHDVFGDAVDLDVHLQRGDPLVGSRHFEVHVAKMVLVAENVGQHRVAVAFLDQAHRHPSHGALDGNAGVHQRQGRTADAGH